MVPGVFLSLFFSKNSLKILDCNNLEANRLAATCLRRKPSPQAVKIVCKYHATPKNASNRGHYIPNPNNAL